MHPLLRAFTGLFLGALCGGAGGALTLWLVTYFDDSSGFLGPARNWAPLMAVAGLILGALFGGAVGLVVASAKMRVLYGAVTGAAGGWIASALLFIQASRPVDGEMHRQLWQVTGLTVLTGILTGALVSLATNALQRRAARSATDDRNEDTR